MLIPQVDELRDMLESGSDEDDELSSIDYSGPGPSMALFGFRAAASSLRSLHPSSEQAAALFDFFLQNVLPMVHIFHKPTLFRSFYEHLAVLDSIDRNSEALLFSIYYSAVISLTDEESISFLGSPRDVLLERYKFAVEQAIARADLLNTQSMVLLQGVVIYLTALRYHDDSRAAWSLTALVFHIAQTMGLHRDGSAFNLRPLDIELRRRLWWHIWMLDFRSSDFHGCEPIIRACSFDTKPPLNINDDDISADMTSPPEEQEGMTDMTVCLIRCDSLVTNWKLYSSSSPVIGGFKWQERPIGMQDRINLVHDLDKQLRSRWAHCFDETNVFCFITSIMSRVIVNRLWLLIYCPSTETPRLDENTRDKLFRIAVDLLRVAHQMITDPRMHRWLWFTKTYPQSYSLAFVLSEICSRPRSPEKVEAWHLVSFIYRMRCTPDISKHGQHWRALSRLIERARYVMEGPEAACNVQRNVPSPGLRLDNNASTAPVTMAPVSSLSPSTTQSISPFTNIPMAVPPQTVTLSSNSVGGSVPEVPGASSQAGVSPGQTEMELDPWLGPGGDVPWGSPLFGISPDMGGYGASVGMEQEYERLLTEREQGPGLGGFMGFF